MFMCNFKLTVGGLGLSNSCIQSILMIIKTHVNESAYAMYHGIPGFVRTHKILEYGEG